MQVTIIFDIEVDEGRMKEFIAGLKTEGSETNTPAEALIAEATSAWQYESLVVSVNTEVKVESEPNDNEPCPCGRPGPVLHLVGEKCCQ